MLVVDVALTARCRSVTRPSQPYAVRYCATYSSLQILPTAALPYFYLNIYCVDSPDCFTVISEHICFLLLVFFCFYTF